MKKKHKKHKTNLISAKTYIIELDILLNAEVSMFLLPACTFLYNQFVTFPSHLSLPVQLLLMYSLSRRHTAPFSHLQPITNTPTIPYTSFWLLNFKLVSTINYIIVCALCYAMLCFGVLCIWNGSFRKILPIHCFKLWTYIYLKYVKYGVIGICMHHELKWWIMYTIQSSSSMPRLSS